MKVKALEWEHGQAYPFGLNYGVWFYQDPLKRDMPNYAGEWLARLETAGLGRFDTEEEAKAAAQADYERRILSALTLKDDPGNGEDDEIAALRTRCEKAEAELADVTDNFQEAEKDSEFWCAKCAELVKVLEPFALMSTEGVVKHTTNYSTVTTVSDYFHTAARVVAQYRKGREADGE
ncbi:hypothetical protein R1538_34885 [Rhizobium leguminosarum]|uniref:hypothetical protein n=1 Tax=Rhizobium leguminosarum TaxID=384 RepID=UPI00293DAD02|nr:hypothetical protein [Rhizobium leguminosarum]MDV4166239.1 hypothetical protein [Rhizobium leguminosarum]